MADDPIDTTDTPFDNAQCAGCGTNVVAVPGRVAEAFCIECGRAAAHITHPWAQPVPVHPAELAPRRWKHPPATYPDRMVPVVVRGPDPDVTGLCAMHRPAMDLGLMSLDPADVAVAIAVHDHLWHNPTGWLIGGPGGADGDVCNPCGGGNKDKTRMEQPRHDLCLRGSRHGGWGRNCPCRHDRPYMRGIKPDTMAGGAPDPAAVQARLKESRPEPATPNIPIPTADFLWDPEEEWEEPDA